MHFDILCKSLRCFLSAWTLLMLVSWAAGGQTNSDEAASVLLSRQGNRGVRVHDPSTIVHCQDEYWLFYTGRGVPSYHSKDLVEWIAGPRVFTNALPWVADVVPANPRAQYYWAPDIIHLRDRYLLYFAVSSFGKNTSAIGLASNPTLNPKDPAFSWSDQGVIVQSRTGDNFNAIDPAVSVDAQGGLWLALGSFWSGIKLIQLDPATGKRVAPDSPIYSLAYSSTIEAPFIYLHEGNYFLFLNWGYCCRGVRSTYEIRVGRSSQITGPYLDHEGKDMMQGGGTRFLTSTGPFIGPGHAGIVENGKRSWFSCHFYNAAKGGTSTLAIRPLRWDADGWPVTEVEP